MRAFSIAMSLLSLTALGLALPEMAANNKAEQMQQVDDILAQLPANLPEGLYIENTELCCPADAIGRCGDGSVGTPCCGYGSCNIFCCNCDGGCRNP